MSAGQKRLCSENSPNSFIQLVLKLIHSSELKRQQTKFMNILSHPYFSLF